VQKIGCPSKRTHDHQTISIASMSAKNAAFIVNFLGWKINGTIVPAVKKTHRSNLIESRSNGLTMANNWHPSFVW
jgi:hypothetical protein